LVQRKRMVVTKEEGTKESGKRRKILMTENGEVKG
jgi:hypothetical protein